MENNIKKYRKAKNITQEEMADKLNVSRQSYINYENGDTEPSFDTLKNISRILNTSIDDLLGNSLFFENNDTTVDNIINDLNIIIQKYKK